MTRRRRVTLLYLALLALSWGVEAWRDPVQDLPPGIENVSLPVVGGPPGKHLRLAYRDLGPRVPDTPVVLLLHGSPGGRGDFEGLARALEKRDGRFRLLIPDLPGFGLSTREVPDYSIEAHGRYALALLDALGVESAHWVAFSMGGGVALSAASGAPERARSLVLLSAIGVQEYELLGDYDLNHLVHGLQLFCLRTLDWGVPHFGALDAFPLNAFYARNFYDSDQRPLREVLTSLRAPTLILHGESDPLVSLDAAREHARLVPQSELRLYPEGHFVLWQRGAEVAEHLHDFWMRVERGEASTRASAEASRRAASAEPFAPMGGRRSVLAWVAFAFLVLAATLVSEDLTCIGVGFLVARGQIDFGAGVAACVFGLWVGDLLLYAMGRLGAHLGTGWMSRKGRTRLEAARARFGRAGAALILGSRFLPGARLPIYLGAGASRYPVGRFALLLLLGAAVWTPTLVGAAALFGDVVLESLGSVRRGGLWALIVTALLLVGITRVGIPLLSHRGRRLWRGRVERWRRWEFWPMWLFYPPVAVCIAWLGLRHGGLRTATAANPAIPGGGLVGESKWDILCGLAAAGDAVADTLFLPAGDPPEQRLQAIHERLGRAAADHPIVLKPDVGERGKGVSIVRGEDHLRRELAVRDENTLAQEYIPGVEFGVFYARHPERERGEIISITDKQMLSVQGDGERSLEQLILDDPRAVCMAGLHLTRHANTLDEVLAVGETRALTELGTHSRGALFLDGGHLASEALHERIESISRGYEGFFFGRYDLRCESAEAFRVGAFHIVELNGLSSESTHIYDPKNSLFRAYRTLFAQWRIAFEIGASNRRRHEAILSWGALWRLLRSART